MLWERKREKKKKQKGKIADILKILSIWPPIIQAKITQIEEGEISTMSTYSVKMKHFAYLCSLVSST